MAVNVQPSGGASHWLGFAFANPAAPQAPIAATTYIPIDPDKTKLVYDPKRTEVAAASGSIWANGWVVDEDGTVKFTVAFPMFHAYGQELVFGFLGTDQTSGTTVASSVGKPLPMCFEFNEAGGVSTQLAGCIPTSLDIETQSKGVPMITIEYEGTVPPLEITPSVPEGSTPAYVPATDSVYSWPDFQSATLLADGAGVTSIDTFKFKIGYSPDSFYGNQGTGLPTDITATLGDVTFEFQKLLKGTTNEMLRFINNGRTPGLLVFGWQSGADSVLITLGNSIYKTGERTSGLKKSTIESYKGSCLAPAGQVPLTYTVAN